MTRDPHADAAALVAGAVPAVADEDRDDVVALLARVMAGVDGIAELAGTRGRAVDSRPP